MRSHLHLHVKNLARDLARYDEFNFAENRRYGISSPLSRLITVKLALPRPLALRARREVYTYPIPVQSVLHTRVIRRPLWLPSRAERASSRPGALHQVKSYPWVMTKVRIRVPRRLPAALPSYVSVHRDRINIHSRRQLQALLASGELNRRRYSEHKTNRRKARHGQLDSPGATAFGLVRRAYRSGAGVHRLADAALVARAILKGRF